MIRPPGPVPDIRAGSRFLSATNLLTAGANVNAKLDGQQEGAEGFTALMWAAYGGHKDIVDLLIKKGAGLEAKSDRGYTPLILAATAGSVDLIELFLSQVSLHP